MVCFDVTVRAYPLLAIWSRFFLRLSRRNVEEHVSFGRRVRHIPYSDRSPWAVTEGLTMLYTVFITNKFLCENLHFFSTCLDETVETKTKEGSYHGDPIERWNHRRQSQMGTRAPRETRPDIASVRSR